MCNAKKNAQATVSISPVPHTMCGGPSMNPAPKVARTTPTIIIRVGALSLIFTERIAVNTTYNDVKNADTEGLTDFIPIICNTNPASIRPPKISPPFQSSLDVKATLAVFENGNKATNAIKNLAATITPTTPAVEYSVSSVSSEFIACFIQTKVPPQSNVTKNKPTTACCRLEAINRGHVAYF